MSSYSENRYRLVFGSNTILSTGSVVTFDDGERKKDLVSLQTGSDGMPEINARVDDADGKIIAGITASRPLHIRKGYQPVIGPGKLRIENESTGDVPLEFEYLDGKTVKLNGTFYIAGEKLVATDEGLTWKGLTVSNSTFSNMAEIFTYDSKNNTVSLGSSRKRP